MGFLTDRINNKLESNLIHEHALNSEPVPYKFTIASLGGLDTVRVMCLAKNKERPGKLRCLNKM